VQKMKHFILLFFTQLLFLGQAQRFISLSEADQALQKNNLILLSQQFNLSIAQANVIQAKIWEQPYITTEFNAINPQENRVFDIGSNGQKQLAIQQLIYLGGKKKNEVDFAKSNAALAEIEFEQLLRNLKFQLELQFYTLYFDRQKVASINSQIQILDTLYNQYSIQVSNGNMSLKEMVRLQSLVLNLKNERNKLVNEIIQNQENLSLLTGITEQINPTTDELDLINSFQSKLLLKDEIIALSLQNNLELKSSMLLNESQELYLRWQKSLAIPDLTAGVSYDQRGGAFNNQVNLTIGIPLPLWNKNKGNIKVAEFQLKQKKLDLEFKKLEIQTRVESTWSYWLQQKSQLNSIEKTKTDDLQIVYKGMVDNFQKRNISMIEFTDFMESYNQSIIQINEIKKDWILSCIGFNLITNQEIF
jgi:outer membrane protein, heavy metal efflux system